MRGFNARLVRLGQRAGRGQGGVDGHHLGVHAQDGVGIGLALAGEHVLEGLEGRLDLSLVLGLVDGEGLAGQVTGLESAAIETGAVIIETLADHLASLYDDATMALTEGGELGLLKTQTEVIVKLHFESIVEIEK